MPNVIVDTNIFIRALLGSSEALELINGILLKKKFRLIVSRILLKEIIRSANKSRLSPLIPGYKLTELMDLLKDRATSIKVVDNITICRDAKDNFILEMAIKSRARFIVTLDKDLLVLNPLDKTEIITPSEFLQRIKA